MPHRSLFFVLVLVAISASAGCVKRRLLFTVKDIPDAVTIYLDGEPIGKAPVFVHFDSYGEREWAARADGYETASGRVTLEAPWYEYPPADLFAEVLYPGVIVDEHEVVVEMKPLKPRNLDEIEERAQSYRETSHRDLKDKPPPK